ncbi:MAG: 16S rRNA (adenine(1518)-N(6)/adenine(1519)-N(6))-dimethyltransferase RsmA, partial [bacterium]
MDKIIANPGVTMEILDDYQLHLYKGMGQNLLVDQNILDIIVDSAGLKANDTVIEIGPGIGSLTQKILEVLNDGILIAIEKDKRLIEVLQDIFNEESNLELVKKDVLDINWIKFLKNRNISDKDQVKVLANLPYYITTPIIMNTLESDFRFSRMVFMVQKEVGERMVAVPGNKDFGALTVAVQYLARAEIVHTVSPNVFMPRPGVESSIIKLEPYSKPQYTVKNKEFLFKIVKSIFQQRRKNIKNSLTKASLINLER